MSNLFGLDSDAAVVDDEPVGKSYGTPGESARLQAQKKRERIAELERLEQSAQNWDGGARGEESTAAAIDKRCPSAIQLADRRMPDSVANVDHIVLVPSGVWVIDSKRWKGKIKVENTRNGTQKLTINGHNQTELVDKLTRQVNAVRAVMGELDANVPVYGALCFHLPADTKLELLNPRFEDHGLPLFKTWTINGYPLFYPRQMCRRLNSAGTLTVQHLEELAASLAERLPSAAAHGTAHPRTGSFGQAASRPWPKPRAHDQTVEKDVFKKDRLAEQAAAWDAQRPEVEAAIGGPIPDVLTERLTSDGAIWCHHALWHSRVYLAYVHDRVGSHFAWGEAWSVVAPLHHARAFVPQWNALTAFLRHLQFNQLVDLTLEGPRVISVTVVADLTSLESAGEGPAAGR